MGGSGGAHQEGGSQEGGYGAVADAGGGAAQPGHAGEAKKRARGAAEACDLPIAGGGTSLPQSCTRSLGREEAEERQERKEEEVTPRPDCRALPVFGSLSLSQRRWWQRLLGFFVPHWPFVYLHIFEFFF